MKNKSDTRVVDIKVIPKEFFDVYMDKSFNPAELSEMFGVGKRTIRKWKQSIREEVGFVREIAMPEEVDVDELILERQRKFNRKVKKKRLPNYFLSESWKMAQLGLLTLVIPI